MAYVDGFLIPVPKRNRAKYKKMSTQAGKVWIDHGALGYHECVADDVRYGKQTSFPDGVKLKKGEEVWFSWIVYRSRKDRDRVNAQGDEGSAARAHDGSEGHAVRRQAHGVRRLQDGRAVCKLRIKTSTQVPGNKAEISSAQALRTPYIEEAVRAAWDPGRAELVRLRSVFISDVHLGSRDCRAAELLQFLAICRSRLSIPGRRHRRPLERMRRTFYWPQQHNDVLRAILGKARDGAQVIYIPGNHDEDLREFCGSVFGNLADPPRATCMPPPTGASCWSCTATSSTRP